MCNCEKQEIVKREDRARGRRRDSGGGREQLWFEGNGNKKEGERDGKIYVQIKRREITSDSREKPQGMIEALAFIHNWTI